MTMWYGHKIGTAWPLWWHVFFFPRGIAQRLLITVEEIRRVVRLLVSSLRNIFSARRIHHAYCSSVERVRSLQIASGVWSDDKAIGIRSRFEILIENDLETRSYKSEIVVRRSFVIRARYHYLIRTWVLVLFGIILANGRCVTCSTCCASEIYTTFYYLKITIKKKKRFKKKLVCIFSFWKLFIYLLY